MLGHQAVCMRVTFVGTPSWVGMPIAHCQGALPDRGRVSDLRSWNKQGVRVWLPQSGIMT